VYGKHPDITKMRVWGCPSTVTLQPRPAKEILPGKNGIFVGYDLHTPAYQVYEPDSGKLHTTMQVKFHEIHILSGRAKANATKTELARAKLLDAAHSLTCDDMNPCDHGLLQKSDLRTNQTDPLITSDIYQNNYISGEIYISDHSDDDQQLTDHRQVSNRIAPVQGGCSRKREATAPPPRHQRKPRQVSATLTPHIPMLQHTG
jgi:hypothetical protein